MEKAREQAHPPHTERRGLRASPAFTNTTKQTHVLASIHSKIHQHFKISTRPHLHSSAIRKKKSLGSSRGDLKCLAGSGRLAIYSDFLSLKLHLSSWGICEPEVQGQNLACTESRDSYIRVTAEQVSISEMCSQTTNGGWNPVTSPGLCIRAC